MIPRRLSLTVLACLSCFLSRFCPAVDTAPETPPVVSPEAPFDYRELAFYPDRWQEHGFDTRLLPWKGTNIAFLTIQTNLEVRVIKRFLDRLDAGWQLYADLTGQSPQPFKLLQGRPIIAAVPDGDLTCGYGCGFICVTGIEVAGFYDADYGLVQQQPEAFPHYYFYEMGRNYYTFEDRHSLFITGYAVFMRYVCMDALGCTDPDRPTRTIIEQAEALYAKSDLDFLQAFTTLAGLDEKAPRLKQPDGQPLQPSDQPVLYASAMLKLHREHGGTDWVRRFFVQLAKCPSIQPETLEAAQQQALSWFVAAACAARTNLSEVFVDRWRFPLGSAQRAVLSAIAWNKPETDVPAVLQALANAESTQAERNLLVPPFVQPLTTDSVAITWHTAQPAYGWVEFGSNTVREETAISLQHGLREANVHRHQVILHGLSPGATYHYRVGFKPIVKFEAYHVDFEAVQYTPVATFQMLPAPDAKVTTVVYNDLHNRQDTLAQLYQIASRTPFDFTLFNGDCIADPAEAKPTLSTLAGLVRTVRADAFPAVFIRGNHETRGAFARQLPKYFAWPDHQPYFAITAGPVRWLILDCGEDKPDDHPAYSGLVDFETFRRQETEWLQTELKSRDFRDATWRVLVHHIPLYSARASGGYHHSCRQEWGELLAHANIDLAINAHTHHPAFHPANSIGNPYPIYVGGGPEPENATVMIVEADAHKLTLQIRNIAGETRLTPFTKTRSP